MWKRVALASLVAMSCASVSWAQGTTTGGTTATQGGTSQQQAATGTRDMPVETRPATTNFMGDTGLWFVPTGDVLPARRWSASVYRVNHDYNQGFTDVSDWPITIGAGLGDRAEVFGAVSVVRRIDRDRRGRPRT